MISARQPSWTIFVFIFSSLVCSTAAASTDLEQTGEPVEVPRNTTPILDDGGADAACGADRRCRIERLATRNRLQRQYDAAQHEAIVRQETERVLSEQQQERPRVDRHRIAAYHNTPYGHGLIAGYTFGGMLRPELTLLSHQDRVGHSFGGGGESFFSERHTMRSVGAHMTGVYGDSTLVPLASVGFVMGRGDLGGGSWTSDWRAEVKYHFLTAAVGAEAQLESGLLARMTFTLGRVLYNQVRYGPGNYDDVLRPVMRDHMHSGVLRGVSISLGWAF